MKLNKLALLLPAIAFVGLSTAVLGDEMTPLSVLIANGSEETFPIVRCGGLYLSGLEWAGEEALGEENSNQTKLVIYRLIELATEMRKPDMAENAQPSVMRDIRSISDLYLERYAQNYASVGKAFEDDELWASDVSVCNLLLGGDQ